MISKLKRILAALAFVGAFASIIASVPANAQYTDQATWLGTSGGAANAPSLTIHNVSSIPTGVKFLFLPNNTNTGPTTLALASNSGSIGSCNLFKKSGAGAVTLSGGELISSPVPQLVEFSYDGTQCQIVSSINDTAAQALPTPQGYLTPCNYLNSPTVTGCTAGTILPTGDVSAVSVLSYTPYVGNQLPIWNGSNMVQFQFPELTLSIPTSRAANTLYDVCVFNNAGTPTIVFGPAWTTSTPGSGARGTGAGSAQISRLQGIWTNTVSISGINGANTYSIPASQCTIVGTVLIGSSNGQVSYTRTYGQSRVWSSWNFYNRLPLLLAGGDPSASWTLAAPTTLQAAHGSNANSLVVVSGLAEEAVDIRNTQICQYSGGGTAAGGIMNNAIGINATNAASGKMGQVGNNAPTGIPGLTTSGSCEAQYQLPPFMGSNGVFALESATASSGGLSATFSGLAPGQRLSAEWRG